MQKQLHTLVLFLNIFIFLNHSIVSQTSNPNQLSDSWMVVDIQGLDGTELLETELEIIGNTWHFLSREELLIENYQGIYSIAFQQKGSELSYLGRTVFIQEKDAYNMSILDQFNGRKVMVFFRKTEPLTVEKKAQIIDMKSKIADLNLSPIGFDFSFEEDVIVSKPSNDTIYESSDEMPRFPACEDELILKEREQCAIRELLGFIYRNIEYPALARENNVEGTVVITFVVEKDGSLSDIAILKDLEDGCGEEALFVVSLMNQQNIRWIPGIMKGEIVRVQFNLPIKFKLE